MLIETCRELVRTGEFAEALIVLNPLSVEIGPTDEQCTELLQLQIASLHGMGDWENLAAACQQMIRKLRKSGNDAARAHAHGHLGSAEMRLGNPRIAEDHFRAAIHIAIWDLEDPYAAIPHRRRLAIMFQTLGLWPQAIHESLYAVDQARESSRGDQEVAALFVLAVALLKSGRLETLPEHLNRIDNLVDQTERLRSRERAALLRANYLRLTGHSSRALEVLASTLIEARTKKYSREEAICLEYTGDCYLAQRDYKRAFEHYQAAQAIAEATAPKGDLIPELGHRLGECLVHLGDANAAILACERGLRVALDTGDRYEECATQRVLAMAHRAAGNPTKAFRIAQEGVELGRRYEIPYELARTLHWVGETRLQSPSEDERSQGRQCLWDARAVFERLDLKQWLKQIDSLLGFEEESTAPEEDPGLAAVKGLEALDRGALRFGVVTVSAEVGEAVATIQSIAPSRIPVLITGPSGTGKELLARALHQMSDRRRKPFVPVNCAALAPGLLDSELFGHERGAFTGAVASRDGLFASADGGTLFLDEVGELSPTAQATLLRILESGELRRVGTDEIKKIDVRVVAATNASLEEMVERGTFRRDLYYRMAGTSVSLPALAEREEDIVVLFRYFFAEAIAASRKRLTVAPEVETLLRAYAWPGNVRELKNEVARAVAMADDGAMLGREAFLPRVQAKSATALRRDRDIAEQDAAERNSILHALRAHRGNKADAARSLGGMKRTTLLYKIDRLNIRPEEYLAEEGR